MLTLLATLGLAVSAAIAAAPPTRAGYDRADALAVSQAAVGRRLGPHVLRDVDGQPFALASLEGRPMVVSLVYTSCYHVCPLITRNVEHTIEIAREALGDDAFSVVTIGFDWAVDTPERMRIYATQQGISDARWHFLSGDATSIEALTSELGFRYFASAKGFDHLAQTTVVDGEGRVYRQVYGADFDPPALVEPLKELVFDTPRDAGLVEHWVDTLKLFCTVYDPNSGRYRFDYSIFMTILVGTLCLGAIAAFIVREWRRAR